MVATAENRRAAVEVDVFFFDMVTIFVDVIRGIYYDGDDMNRGTGNRGA